ncbi:MAG: deoxyribose-phosphate aldolase [Methanobrevibacter sp.]|jgi:deoxyribose-phosphate aldolase|nr:deoxyribose-phosphate aldolase [Methanobrevibacter sp.]
MKNFKSIEELGKVIESTYLKNNGTIENINKLIDDAIDYGFYSVVVSPYYVEYAKNKLKNKNIKVGTVIGFPLGYNKAIVKEFEVKDAIENGVDEIDVVLNISAIKTKDYDTIKDEIERIISISKNKKGKNIIVKTIIETGLLEKNEMIEISQIASELGVDFIKTSTGFNNIPGAKATDIRRIRRVNPNIKIKASGGINNYKTAFRLLSAGADRLGTSSAVEIIEEFKKITDNYDEHQGKPGLI